MLCQSKTEQAKALNKNITVSNFLVTIYYPYVLD